MPTTHLPRTLPAAVVAVRPVRGGAIGVPLEAAANACPTAPASAKVPLLGLDFADLTVAQAASRVAQRPDGTPFGYVVTPNADHLVRLSRDPLLGALYRRAILCLLDSRVVFSLGRLLGVAVPRVVPGSELTEQLLAHHLRPGERITIVGLSPLWLPALVARYGLAPPAHCDPPMGFEHYAPAFEAVVAFVRDNPARFVFLAVGSPRQEYLAAAIAAATIAGPASATGIRPTAPGATVSMLDRAGPATGGATGTGLCVGAALEFLAGKRRRAPRFISRSGLEWLFRLACEPRRLFRRYLIRSPVVIALLVKQRRAARRSVPTPRA